MQWLAPLIIATLEAEIRIVVQSELRHKVLETLSWQYPYKKRTGRLAHEIEVLHNKHEALSSNPSTTKKKGGL
jgi:hypothetical protein